MTDILLLACILLTVGQVPATQSAELPPSTAPAARLSPEEIAARVSALNDMTWATRQKATDDLIAVGEQTYAALKVEFRRTPSYEAKRRIRFIVEQIEFFKATDNRGGFLGIQPTTTTKAHNPAVPEGHLWVRVERVIDGTGAERAGLRAYDFITRINGEPMKDDGRTDFTTWIRRQAPGTKVRFGVLRDGQPLELEATLGRRRADQMDPRTIATAGKIQEARSRFSLWWRKEFDPDGFVDETGPLNTDPQWSLEPARRGP